MSKELIEKNMLCPNCGAQNSDVANFCKNCGGTIVKKDFTKKKIIIAVIILMLIICLGFAIFRVFHFGESEIILPSQNLAQVETPKTNMSEQALKDETADWKKYESSKYGFEIKYPSSLVFKEVGAVDAPNGYSPVYFKEKKVSETVRYPTIDIGMFDNVDKLPLKTWIEENATKDGFDNATGDDVMKFFYKFDWGKVTAVKIGELDGYRFMNSASSSDYQDYVLFRHGYQVFYVRSIIVGNGNLEDVFGKMYPTFKFTK